MKRHAIRPRGLGALFCYSALGGLLVGLGPGHLLAQGTVTGFLNREVGEPGYVVTYQVYLPRGFERGEELPLVVYLHGASSGGEDGLRQTEGGLGDAIRQNSQWFPAVALFPQAPAGRGWEDEIADRALQQIDATIAEFGLDPDRVYLTGSSMGGEGVYYLAMRHPSRFAGLVVSCGSPFTPAWRLEELGRPPVDRSSAGFAEVARALRDLPLRAFHGGADDVVLTEEARAMERALRGVGADVALKEYPGLGHEACGRAYLEEDLWPWLFSQERPRD